MSEEETPLFDGSLSESLQHMKDWTKKRHDIYTPKPLFEKLRRAHEIVMKNKLNFFLLLLIYFAAETIGNAGLLVFQWTLDKDSPHTSYLILVQLTANLPVRIWRALLNSCVLHVVLQALKRNGNELLLSDIIGIKDLISWKMFFAMFIADLVLASPMAIAQALFATDFVWAVVYMIFGFLLNWIFGMAQILLFEEHTLSIGSCFVWSASAALSPATFGPLLLSCVVVFFGAPLVITAPWLLVLQLLTFFEVFGDSSGVEGYYVRS